MQAAFVIAMGVYDVTLVRRGESPELVALLSRTFYDKLGTI